MRKEQIFEPQKHQKALKKDKKVQILTVIL